MNPIPLPLVLSTFKEKLNFNCQETGDIAGISTFQVDFSDWNTVLSDKNPCIWVRAENIPEDIPYLSEQLQDIVREKSWQNEAVLVIVDADAPELKQILPHDLLTFIILDWKDQNRISQASSPTAETLNIILSQVSRSRLAPYEKHRPVVGAQFFGRRGEINKILDNPKENYLILGIRRVGKTSLLKELERQMNKADKPGKDQIRRLYIDCSVIESENEFLRAITYQLDKSELKMLMRQTSQSMRQKGMIFERFYKLHGGMITFLIDEVDRMLVRLKEPEDFFNTLRSVSTAEYARFILAGFRLPMRDVFDQKKSLHHMVDTINLGKLKYEDVYKMVTQPMEKLRISFRNREGIVNRIYRETAGLPNYVQFYCSTLLNKLDARRESILREEDLAAVYEDREFRDFVLETFLNNTDPVEQALVFAMMLEGGDAVNQKIYSMRMINGFLKRHKLDLTLEQLGSTLQHLEVAGVIDQVGQDYEFSIPLLIKLLRSARNVEFMIEKLREQILAERLLH
jgi:Cdc6-like AAA superfamily ATPase